MGKNTKHKTKNNKGFSVIELLVVTVISIALLGTVAVGYKGFYSSMGMDETIADVSIKLHQARENARLGVSDATKRTFDVANAISRPHRGITITSSIIASFSSSACVATTCNGQATMCISNEPICFSGQSTFTFNVFSGKKLTTDVIFIASSNRKMALVIPEDGNFYVCEMVNGYWHWRRELQNLNNQSNTKG
jgi:type II secretory pathway pseudopilin PulG